MSFGAMELARAICSAEYDRALRVALRVQIPTALLSVLVLDFGQTARVCGVAMLGFWLAAALVAVRPTTGDLRFWRWGFIPCFARALTLAAWV
jgi:hypothetical protein